jgi:CysZ protein
MRYLFLFIVRITAFYLAFLFSYTLTCPGYVFLSAAVENIRQRSWSSRNLAVHEHSAAPYATRFLVDLREGCKIGLLGILVTIVALLLNFIPVLGQILAFLLYVFYSALMFIDYPASNRHWPLRRKINWLRRNYIRALRLGILPALISIVPFINIPLMALFFPVFTVHTTLNFMVSAP